ncbi:MAG: hypothetical protein BGP16_06120 [Sphingobium sp. 66-54]|nr:MAG: hypothetical protein BGP16_06120 [Sphingobium sp. 66-54]
MAHGMDQMSMAGSIGFEIVPGSGLFLVHCEGMWTPDQARAHFARMEQSVRTLRRMRRPVRVLVDLRAAHVQTPETSAVMAQGSDRVHRAADRVAFVGANALHALQVKRDVTEPQIAVFQDMDEARAWVEQPDDGEGKPGQA